MSLTHSSEGMGQPWPQTGVQHTRGHETFPLESVAGTFTVVTNGDRDVTLVIWRIPVPEDSGTPPTDVIGSPYSSQRARHLVPARWLLNSRELEN